MKYKKPAPQVKRKIIADRHLTKNSYEPAKISAQDAFDLNNIKDLPEITKRKLGTTGLRGIIRHIFSDLFEMKSILSIDEMQVGVYRVFGLEKPREWITSNVSTLKKKGLIKNVSGQPGVYEQVK